MYILGLIICIILVVLTYNWTLLPSDVDNVDNVTDNIDNVMDNQESNPKIRTLYSLHTEDIMQANQARSCERRCKMPEKSQNTTPYEVTSSGLSMYNHRILDSDLAEFSFANGYDDRETNNCAAVNMLAYDHNANAYNNVTTGCTSVVDKIANDINRTNNLMSDTKTVMTSLHN